MYRLKIVQNDYKGFELDASSDELEAIISAIKHGVMYTGPEGKGIYVPNQSLRYILIEEREKQCQQKNQNSEPVSDLPVSKEN